MKYGVGHLDSFLFNDNNRNLHFTGHADSKEICFLDVRLAGVRSNVTITLYGKPLSGHSLLQA